MTDYTTAKQYQRVIRSSRKPKNDRQYNGQKIFWSLYCLSFFCLLLLLITLWYLLSIALFDILRFTVISDYPLVSFGHCIVCYSSVYSYFWLPFGIFWPLYCLSFFGLRLLLITLWYLLAIVLSVIRVIRSSANRRITDNTMAKRYQRVIRNNRKPKNDKQCNGQKIPKGNQK
jgi:preprotein translocase subunit Sss1